jgi:hypothetical protein
MTTSIATTNATTVMVISAYAASNQQLPAVASPPSWVVIGGFYMPMTETTRLEAVGSVAGGATGLSVRFFDVADAVPVDGSLTETIASAVDVRALSGAFELVGGKVYQVQAQCIGPSGFGIIRTAQPISA